MGIDGAAINFSQNWNFELKIFLVIALRQKIGSRRFSNHLQLKNESKTAKKCQSAAIIIGLFSTNFQNEHFQSRNLKTKIKINM